MKIVLILLIFGLLFFSACAAEQPVEEKEINSSISFSNKVVAEGEGYTAEISIGGTG